MYVSVVVSAVFVIERKGVRGVHALSRLKLSLDVHFNGQAFGRNPSCTNVVEIAVFNLTVLNRL